MRAAFRLPTLSVLSLVLGGCSTAPASLAIAITAGQETDAFSATPAVTRVDVTLTSLDKSVSETRSAAPLGTFDFGNVVSTEQVSLDVTGYAADGSTKLLRGRSLSGLLLSSLEGTLPIFAQRLGQWARPPNGLSHSHVGGAVTVLTERYLLLAGGRAPSSDTTMSPANLDGYDEYGLAGDTSTPLPITPLTMVSVGEALLLLSQTGARWLDFSTGTETAPTLPAGLTSFGDVAGGSTVIGSSNEVYVVGASRTGGAATAAVISVDTSGNLTAFSLSTPRSGAAAAWITGAGLVVVGGSSTGRGVEVLAEGGTSFVAADFPADPTTGAGLAAYASGGHGGLLVGGTFQGGPAPTRIFDATCLSGCTMTPKDTLALPVALTGTSTFATTNGACIVVGQEAQTDGLDRTFLVQVNTNEGVTELPLREPRRGAAVIPTPKGTLAIVGGEHSDGTPALSIEEYFPE